MLLIKPPKLTQQFLSIFLFILGSLFYSHSAYAAINLSQVDLATMVNNLANDVPQLMQLVTATAYVMGIFFIFKGLMALKQFGESRTMMSSSHELKGPLIYIFVGAALLYLPTTVMYSLGTFFTTYPYSYVDDTSNADPWSTLIQSIFVLLQLIGTIAFIRGLVILTHLGNQGGQPGQFGRALAHMVGGVFLINIWGFINAIIYTLYGQTF